MSTSRPASTSRLRPAARLNSRSGSRRPTSRLGSRAPSLASIPYLPQGPEALLNPDGEAAELLHEFVHPHRHDADATLVEDDAEDGDAPGADDGLAEASAEWRRSLPWWKRPSPLWILMLVPFTSIAMAATMAPRIEIYTRLACDAYKPEYTIGRGSPEHSDPGVILFGHISPSTIMDDKTYELCASDPIVQKAVSKLSLAMITTMGVLGCITTAWWGSLSDRWGRIRVIGCATFGILITDCSFIMVANFARKLPGGYWFLIVGPIVEGTLGGLSTVSAALHAYMADCSEPAARARTFSLFIGLMFTGMSIGPVFSSLLVKLTGQALAVFYVATAVHIFSSFLIWFIIPESLSPEQRAQSKKLHTEEVEQLQDLRSGGGLHLWPGRIFGFLSPLHTLLFPTERVQTGDNPLKRKKRNYSLFFVVAGHGVVLLIAGSITPKLQYTTLRFHWNSEKLGYWQTIVGAARALHLTVVMPLIIHLFQPKQPAIQLPVEPDEPLNAAAGPSEGQTESPSPAKLTAVSSPRHHHSPVFDLNLARCSLLLDFVATILTAFAQNGTAYTAFSLLGAFGGGFGPAVNSVISTLYMSNGGKELGKLFGALGVVQAICMQIVGPSLYGVTFMKTVGTLPQTVFFLTAGLLFLSFLLLSCVRLPKASQGDEEEVDSEIHAPQREVTLVDVQEPLVIVEDEED